MRDMDAIAITPEIREALRIYEVACARYLPGGESASVVEIPLIELATLVVAAVGLPTPQDRYDELFGGTLLARRARRR